MFDAAQVVAQVGDQHVVDLAIHKEQLLCLIQPQHDHGEERAQRPSLFDNRFDAEGNGNRADVDIQHIAHVGGQLLGAQAIEIDITLAQLQTELGQHPVDLAAEGVEIERIEDVFRHRSGAVQPQAFQVDGGGGHAQVGQRVGGDAK